METVDKFSVVHPLAPQVEDQVEVHQREDRLLVVRPQGVPRLVVVLRQVAPPQEEHLLTHTVTSLVNPVVHLHHTVMVDHPPPWAGTRLSQEVDMMRHMDSRDHLENQRIGQLVEERLLLAH